MEEEKQCVDTELKAKEDYIKSVKRLHKNIEMESEEVLARRFIELSLKGVNRGLEDLREEKSERKELNTNET